MQGTPFWAKKLSEVFDNYASFSVCYFESAKLEIFEFDDEEIDSVVNATLELNERLKKIPNLKGVEVLNSGNKEYVALFMDTLTKGLEEIPFFGAEAGAVDTPTATIYPKNNFHKAITAFSVKESNQYVASEKVHRCGVILVAYSGEDLHIKAEYNFGWKVLGKEMTITETQGINGVSKIDGVPAAEIYKKYLNVELNKFLIFNVFDFPFVVNRGGLPASRVAAIYDEEGRLFMTGDVKQGEMIRLSYGNPEEILRETWESSERIRKFDPQANFTYLCGARTVFLGADSKRELRDFSRINPNTSFCFGGGEIYKQHGAGGQLATALIAVAMRLF